MPITLLQKIQNENRKFLESYAKTPLQINVTSYARDCSRLLAYGHGLPSRGTSALARESMGETPHLYPHFRAR
jgi:hypothetical protein